MKKHWIKTKDSRIKKRGEYYWARFTRREVKVEESLSTKSFVTAQRMVEDIESNILLGVNWRKERELFETAWPDFLSDKAKGIKTKIARDKTLKEYIGFGEREFLPFFSDCRITDVDEKAWEDFVEHVRKSKPDILFFNMRKYLMGFLSWAKRKGKIREVPELYNPDIRPDEDDENEGPGKEFAESEMETMQDLAFMPFKLCLFLAQYMCMRSSEITQLHKKRIDKTARMIRLRRVDTKTGHPRAVPIHDEVWPLLLEQLEASSDSPFLFPNRVDHNRPMDPTGFKKPWNEIRESGGIDGRFHDLKHTWITNAIRSGMNIAVVAKIAGTSIKVIERTYLHLTEKDLSTELLKFSIKRRGHKLDRGVKAEEHAFAN